MEEDSGNGTQAEETKGFKGYALKRIAVGIVLAFGALWVFGTLLGVFGGSTKTKMPATVSHAPGSEAVGHGETGAPKPGGHDEEEAAHGGDTHAADTDARGSTAATAAHAGSTHATGTQAADAGHGEESAAAGRGEAASAAAHGAEGGHDTPATTAHGEAETHDEAGKAAEADHRPGKEPEAHAAADSGHGEAAGHAAAEEDAHGAGGHGTVFDPNMPAGVAFIDAAIQPLSYELYDRWWGWRPNDIVDITDNVNNFQLGVLEVTRRTAVVLAERISRTGSTAAFDKNLENAMNWFMIKADRYWFPSPESKYKDGLAELKAYRDRLARGEAKFYTRTDNLIPLLMAFEDLMGSCDENLVKHAEDDGSHVSFFSADDYFYYARGVASAMHSILEAVQHDFATVVETRRGSEVLHHAIESCREAMEIDPLIVLDSGWDSLFANHRANMAAPISHARFYLGVLIKTLST